MKWSSLTAPVRVETNPVEVLLTLLLPWVVAAVAFEVGWHCGHREILSVGHPMVYRQNDQGEWQRGFVEAGDWVYWREVH